MATRDDVLNDLRYVTQTISTQVRSLALSVIAFVWLLIIGGTDAPILPQPPDKGLLLLVGVLCLVALLLDYVQYTFGYLSTKATLDAGPTAGEYTYNNKGTAYVIRMACFWLKQAVVVFAFLTLGYVIGRALFSS